MAGILVLGSIPVESVLGQNSDTSDKSNFSIGWDTGTFGAPSYVVGSGPQIRLQYPKSRLIVGYQWSILGPGNAQSIISAQLQREKETKWRLAGRPVSRYVGMNALVVGKMYLDWGDNGQISFLYRYDEENLPAPSSFDIFSGPPDHTLFLSADYGYNWPVYKAVRLTINASAGASVNVALVTFFPYTALIGYLGLAYFSVDGALTMDLYIGRL